MALRYQIVHLPPPVVRRPTFWERILHFFKKG